jgi:hypothetical protein
MASLNKMPDADLEELRCQFLRAMVAAHRIFDADAFRKRYSIEASRSPINKALFEAWSVNLAGLNDDQIERLTQRRTDLIEKFIQLMNTRDFNEAVSQGTGDVKKVNTRFRQIALIIREVLK